MTITKGVVVVTVDTSEAKRPKTATQFFFWILDLEHQNSDPLACCLILVHFWDLASLAGSRS